MNPLRHLAAKLNASKAVTGGYIGSGHLEGQGASDPTQTSFRSLTTNWLKKNDRDELFVK